MAYIGKSVIGVEHPSTSALNATTGTFSGAVSTTSLTGSTSLKTPLIEFTDGDDAIAIADGGLVTMPAQPAFCVVPASQQVNLAKDGYVDVAFGTEIYDVGGNFASNVFTAPVTGKYQLSYQLYCAAIDSAAAYITFEIDTSNRDYFNLIDPDAFDMDAETWTWVLSITADMDANDTAKVRFYQGSGTAQLDVSTASFFTGVLIC
jgi:hypothetical protein